MRIVFMGTPEFALPSLERLHAEFSVAAVFSQPDRPQGRGRKLRPSAVSAWALEKGLPLYRPERLKSRATRELLRSLEPDLLVVVAYRLLPEALLSVPVLGAVNLHASLLPLYRGAAPIQRALMNGETVTGLTTFKLDRGMDTGGILLQEEIPIAPEDDYGSLSARLSAAGAPLLLRTVQGLQAGTLQPRPQPPEDPSWPRAPKIQREDRLLNWREDALKLHNRIRGLSPEPAARTFLRGEPWKIFRTRVLEQDYPELLPGTVIRVDRKSLTVACGRGALQLLEIQPAGKKRMPVASYLLGHPLKTGTSFGTGTDSP